MLKSKFIYDKQIIYSGNIEQKPDAIIIAQPNRNKLICVNTDDINLMTVTIVSKFKDRSRNTANLSEYVCTAKEKAPIVEIPKIPKFNYEKDTDKKNIVENIIDTSLNDLKVNANSVINVVNDVAGLINTKIDRTVYQFTEGSQELAKRDIQNTLTTGANVIEDSLKYIKETSSEQKLKDTINVATSPETKEKVITLALEVALTKGATELGAAAKSAKVIETGEQAVVKVSPLEDAKKAMDKIDTKTITTNNLNAKEALNSKLNAIQTAEKTAVKIEKLDEKIKYYEKEKPSKKEGETRGASYVTEHDLKTNNVKSWMECYDKDGNIIRTYPKTLNGQDLESNHYPPTGKEIEEINK